MDTIAWVAVSLSGAVGIGGVVVACMAIVRSGQQIEALRGLTQRAMDHAVDLKNPDVRMAEIHMETAKWNAIGTRAAHGKGRGVPVSDLVGDGVDLVEDTIGAYDDGV